MAEPRMRVNPQRMAKDVEYVKAKVNEILTADDRPVMGKDIDLLNANQKILLKRTERTMWALIAVLMLDLFLNFFR